MERDIPYLLGFHQHLKEDREASCGEKDLLLPAGDLVTGGMLKVPAMWLAHFLHNYLQRRETGVQGPTYDTAGKRGLYHRDKRKPFRGQIRLEREGGGGGSH